MVAGENNPTARSGLSGLRILVVEDESLIAMLLDDMLAALDCVTVGPAPTLRKGIELAESQSLDGALLDVNLGREPVYPLADLLAARNVPIVFTTGYGVEGVIDRYRAYPTLSKPFDLNAVANALTRMLAFAGKA